MRLPIFVPLLLVTGAVFLIAFNISAIVNASHPSHAQYLDHHDDNLTFVASVQWDLEPGQEIRTPGWSIVVVEGPDGRPHMPRWGDDMERLARQVEFIIIPTWQLEDLMNNGTADVLHRSEDGMKAQTYRVETVPDAASSRPELVGRETVTLVWSVRNTTQEYDEVSQALLRHGIEGRGRDGGREIVAIDTFVVDRDPWLRASAAVLAVLAIGLAVVPRIRMLPAGLPGGPGGAGIEMAQQGSLFLRSLRNAYITLAAAVALLGIPLITGLALFAGSAGAGDPLWEAREQPFLGWQGSVWNLLVLTFAAGVVAAARPAVDAHLALRRWRRHEASPPIEGELAD